MKASFESSGQSDKLIEQIMEFLKTFKGEEEITIQITVRDSKGVVAPSYVYRDVEREVFKKDVPSEVIVTWDENSKRL